MWVPILPTDAQVTVGRATKYLLDARVTHYWDANDELVKGFVPVLGLENDNAWDIYLLYDQNAEWTDAPPKPNFWQEQLGISEATQLDADKLTAEMKKMLEASKK